MEPLNSKPKKSRKWWYIVGGFLGILVVGNLINPAPSAPQAATEINSDAKPDSTTALPLSIRVKNVLTGLNEKYEAGERGSNQALIIEMAIWKAQASIIKEGLASNESQVKKDAKKAKEKLVALQIREFPKLRKAWVANSKQGMWENDIIIRMAGNSGLELVGGFFAANRNIKTTQETLYEMLTTLRFKRVNYKWYEGDDNYTYYDLKSAKDGTLE